MNTTIYLTVKDQYGCVAYHPACAVSKNLAALAKTKTLTLDSIAIIKALGYAIEVKQPVRTF